MRLKFINCWDTNFYGVRSLFFCNTKVIVHDFDLFIRKSERSFKVPLEYKAKFN